MLLVFKTKMQQAARSFWRLVACGCIIIVLSLTTGFPPDFTILWTTRNFIHGAVKQTVPVDYRRIRKMCAPLNLYIIFS
jgi:hypothetical protein